MDGRGLLFVNALCTTLKGILSSGDERLMNDRMGISPDLHVPSGQENLMLPRHAP